MSTDFENELRDLFREKAGEAPLATPSLPASAPRQVLRRGRLHQVGTVLGSAAVVIALIVGSVAGLTRILGEAEDHVGNGGYEIFERTATIDAFTVTSPSDWFLVNRWPVATRLSDEGPPDGPSDVFQLSNVDLGLDAAACGNALPAGAAVLTVSFTEGHIIDSDPYGPWPTEFREATQFDACGEGRYADFTLSGWAFFAWIGFGEGVTNADRTALQKAVDSILVADPWEPTEPDETSPAYVIAGGTTTADGPWRLEVRPGNEVEMTLLVGGTSWADLDIALGSEPLEWCCTRKADLTNSDVVFGGVQQEATAVVFQSDDERADIPGTVVQVPPSLGVFGFDMFFIDGTAGMSGQVVPVGIDGSAEPPPVSEPRVDEVELSGDAFGQRYRVRFVGSFADDSACIRVTVDGEGTEPLCPRPIATSLAGDQPSLHVVNTADLAVVVGSVPPDVVEIRFTSDSGNITQSQSQCQIGPAGWIDPDRRVCAMALPAQDGGTFEYFDSDGDVLFEDGMAWFVSQGEPVAPMPVDPVHGGTYWAVYPWVGAPGDREADDVSAWLLQEYGIESFPGDLACDEGAVEALGTDAEQGIGVYFETQDEANAFASQAGLLGHEADPVIARVTTYCLD